MSLLAEVDPAKRLVHREESSAARKPPSADSHAARKPPSGDLVRQALLWPALLYLGALTQAPFLLTLWYSVHRWILTDPAAGTPFVGLKNFVETIVHDATFRASVVNLIVITLGVVIPAVVLGLAFALLLNREFPLRGLIRALMIAPFFVMPTVNAVVWKNLLLNPIFGFLSWLIATVGLGRHDIFAVAPKAGIMLIAVWQWTPFMMLILLAGLQSLPSEVHEAALVEGVRPWDEFRCITLPLLWPFVELALLLGAFYILQLFGEIYVATQGGPGDATTTLPYYVYQTISKENDVGMASAEAVLAVVIASLIAAVLLRLLTRTLARGEKA
jgi:sorbitol/mannitol transport system permease protein